MNIGTNVMVPLDGSRESEAALRTAIDIARGAGGRLTLLLVATPAYERMVDEVAQIEHMTMDMTASEHLVRIVNTYADELDGLDVHVVTKTDHDAAQTILDVAAAEEVTAIVMTPHTKGPLARLVFGSVASHVVARAPVPVMTVPPQHEAG